MSIDEDAVTVTDPRSQPIATDAGARSLALLRIATGLTFLWAFLDKTFGLGYASPPAKAWIHGGSPTKGFLTGVDVGPFQGLAHAIAGAWWADWLFMLGLLGIGVAVTAGVALRVSAWAGVIMLGMMWLAEFPPATLTATGEPSGSTNPLIDYHVIYALALVVVAATQAGRTWGIGGAWRRIPFVRAHPWAL
jgi:thiosulfate dehydrogenase [quinone] large subunit